MNVVGKTVTHIKYGNGKIIKIEENKMAVDFKTSVKTFIYPDSFGQFFTFTDKKAQQYMDLMLEVITEKQRISKEKQAKLVQAREYARKVSKKNNSHVVFALNDNVLEDIIDNGKAFSGNRVSGEFKGCPRVPKNVNANSACLLTQKAVDEGEEGTSIVGIFMTTEDFVGDKCEDGWIPSHPKYRIIWSEEFDKILFWNYFPEDLRLKKWGSSEIKYLPTTMIKKILEDMLALSGYDNQENEIYEFYDYFCQINID